MCQYVLAVDPGDSTGVALFRDRELLFTMTYNTVSRSGLSHMVYLISNLTPTPDVCVIERPPHRGHGSNRLYKICGEVEKAADHVGIPVEWIGPGLWKPVMNKRSEFSLTTRHEKDAANIGMYHILFG